MNAAAACLLSFTLAQAPAQPLNWLAEDEARADTLGKSGVRTESEHAILWMPGVVSDSTSGSVKRLDRGIRALRCDVWLQAIRN